MGSNNLYESLLSEIKAINPYLHSVGKIRQMKYDSGT